MAPVRGLWKMGLFFAVSMIVAQVGVAMLDGIDVGVPRLLGIAGGVAFGTLLFVWLIGRQYRPAHGEVPVGERQAFEEAAARRIGAWRPRLERTADGFRLDGSTWLMRLPPVIVRYEGAGVRMYGPGLLVKHLVKAASKANR